MLALQVLVDAIVRRLGGLVGSTGCVADNAHLIADLVDAPLEPLHVSIELGFNALHAFLDVADVCLQRSGAFPILLCSSLAAEVKCCDR